MKQLIVTPTPVLVLAFVLVSKIFTIDAFYVDTMTIDFFILVMVFTTVGVVAVGVVVMRGQIFSETFTYDQRGGSGFGAKHPTLLSDDTGDAIRWLACNGGGVPSECLRMFIEML